MPKRIEIATPIPVVWESMPRTPEAESSVVPGVVLAVEPNAKRRHLMRDSLEVLGYSVLEAKSAVQAHVVLGHLNAPPDLVVAGPDVAADLADDSRLPGMVVFSCNRPFTRDQLAHRLAAAVDAPVYPTSRRPAKNSRRIPPQSDARTPPSTSAR